jgi:acetoacetyl-CoA synthetase
VALTDELTQLIRRRIRTGATPRHVPARVIAVNEIPRTRSGKISEIAVRDTIHGRPIANDTALANPESLALYTNLAELKK